MVEPMVSGRAKDKEKPLPRAEVEVGDLVFLHPKDDHTIPKMITQYDHGCFSHVGVMVEPDHVASCRLNDDSFERDDPLDFGGVRVNSLDEVLVRRPHIGRPTFPEADRNAGVQRLLALVDPPAAVGDRSAFSFPKLFMVAAALDAVRPDQTARAREAILSTAARAAASWACAEQQAHKLLPTFFCSEAVCVAYPSRFTYKDFWTFPPDVGVETVLPPAAASFIMNAVKDFLRQEATDEQKSDFLRMTWALLRHDRPFVSKAVQALLDLVRPHGTADPDEPIESAIAAPGPGDPLPTSLVTPRVLHQAQWLEWVRPLENPGYPA